MDAVLVATLGAEPQVISLTTQLLLRQGEPLGRVIVLHTRPSRPPIADALAALLAHFSQREVWPPLAPQLIQAEDVLTAGEIDAFAEALYLALREWVQQGIRVHLLLAGGRKPMAMVGMSVAQIVLGAADRVWYLHSDEALRASGRMTLEPGDRAELIQVPMVQVSAAPPAFTWSLQAGTLGDARQAVERQHRAQVEHFIHHELTAAERALAALVAEEVLTVGQMAARLHKSPKTITNQLNSIYSKLESAFGLLPDRGVKREFLRRELAPYLGRNLGVDSHDER